MFDHLLLQIQWKMLEVGVFDGAWMLASAVIRLLEMPMACTQHAPGIIRPARQDGLQSSASAKIETAKI